MTEFRSDDASPTARALVALELIPDRPGVSGEHLGERLGVTSRAARRYVGILRQAGIPVESTPGRHGGYRVGRGFRVPPLMFSTDEALALVMAAVRGRGAVGGNGAVDAALDKIVRVLPASVVGPVEALRGIGSSSRTPEGPDPRAWPATSRVPRRTATGSGCATGPGRAASRGRWWSTRGASTCVTTAGTSCAGRTPPMPDGCCVWTGSSPSAG